MHELPIITRVLELALDAAPADQLIVRITLRVGRLCDAQPLWLERYLRMAARGTRAEGAALRVVRDECPPLRAIDGGTAGLSPAGLRAASGYTLESIETVDAALPGEEDPQAKPG